MTKTGATRLLQRLSAFYVEHFWRIALVALWLFVLWLTFRIVNVGTGIVNVATRIVEVQDTDVQAMGKMVTIVEKLIAVVERNGQAIAALETDPARAAEVKALLKDVSEQREALRDETRSMIASLREHQEATTDELYDRFARERELLAGNLQAMAAVLGIGVTVAVLGACFSRHRTPKE